MHNLVTTGRHLPAVDNVVHLEKFVRRIARPFGQVQPIPRFTYVIGNQKRDWRHVSIPGPMGIVRVAIRATLHEHLPDNRVKIWLSKEIALWI
jgi:hypothetical protein